MKNFITKNLLLLMMLEISSLNNTMADSLDSTSVGMSPPKYLQVPEFKTCLSSETRETFSVVCLPASKPLACPLDSWNQLLTLSSNGSLAICR